MRRARAAARKLLFGCAVCAACEHPTHLCPALKSSPKDGIQHNEHVFTWYLGAPLVEVLRWRKNGGRLAW